MNDKYFLKINLSFFEDTDKTEPATAKRKRETREKGQVAKSQEVGTAFLLITSFYTIRTFAPYMYNRLLEVFNHGFNIASDIYNVFNIEYITGYINYLFLQSMLIALPMLIVSMLVGLIINIAQVGWHPTTKPLMPKFSKLNPIAGFKRLFSFRSLIELVKSIAKFAVIGLVIYNSIEKEINKIPLLMELSVLESVVYLGNLCVDIGLNIGLFYLFIAGADFAYTKFKFAKDIRMSKHEIKEEFKQMEGNPQIKGKIRQKMREASMRRMMQDVPRADVIITNPTHYAVALRYDNITGSAPVVVAKGVDYVARRIREVATESKVEIVENVQLARTLYSTVDIGQEIPAELYQAVAEVLAFVYKLKNKAG